MISDKIELGIKTEIYTILNVDQKAKDQLPLKYFTKVQNINDENHTFEIGMPIENGKLILLQKGKEYEFVFISKKGNYKCIGKVVRRYKIGPLFMVSVELSSSLERYQRREFYRASCLIDFDFWVLAESRFTEEETQLFLEIFNEEEYQKVHHNGTLIDISGGGIRFRSRQNLEDDRLLRLHLGLTDDRGYPLECFVLGSILSCTELENVKGIYECRCRFLHVEKSTREQIIRYIFQLERKARKTERGI